jgi:hypothetical protein
VLVAAAIALAVVAVLDVAFQRAVVPRLMGLEGAYHANDGWRGEPALVAVDADIGTLTLERARRQIGAGAVSVRWTGLLEVPAGGEYGFSLTSAGRVALIVTGVRVLEGAGGGSPGDSRGSIRLEAGRHPVLLEYAQAAGVAGLALFWSRDRQPREIVPADALLPPRPNEEALRVYRAVRALLRLMFVAAGLVGLGALLVAVTLHGLPAARREPGGLAAAAGLVALLATGAAVLDDFGMSMDEAMQRQIGLANYAYLAHGATRLLDPGFPERVYGPAFETLLVVVERHLGLSDSRAVFLFRHGATFLVFCAGVAFFHRLCLRHFRSPSLAVFGGLCLVLSPRLFADAFYNSKDIPFLAAFVIGVYTLVRFLDEGTVRAALRHALASALLVDVRVVGLVLPAITLVVGTADLLLVREARPSARRRAAALAAYAGLAAALTVVFFPFLWTDPVGRLGEVLRTMSRFPFHRTVLYLGQEMPAAALPWHYLPVWIGVTTPLATVGLLGAGLLGIARSCLARPDRLLGLAETRNQLVFVLWAFGPVAAIVASRAVVYDGWRHVFFVYPALVLIAVEGARRVLGWLGEGRTGGARARPLAALALLLAFGEPLLFRVRHHPYGNVYFNRLAGDGMPAAKERFEYRHRHEVHSVRVGGAAVMTVYDLRLDRWAEPGRDGASP